MVDISETVGDAVSDTISSVTTSITDTINDTIDNVTSEVAQEVGTLLSDLGSMDLKTYVRLGLTTAKTLGIDIDVDEDDITNLVDRVESKIAQLVETVILVIEYRSFEPDFDVSSLDLSGLSSEIQLCMLTDIAIALIIFIILENYDVNSVTALLTAIATSIVGCVYDKVSSKFDFLDLGIDQNLDAVVSIRSYDNREDTGANSDEGFLIKLRLYKGKLDATSELTTLIDEIHEILADKDTSSLRWWVDKVKKIHPDIDIEINDKLYFQAVSEEIGSRTLGYTRDTQSMELSKWADGEYINSSDSLKTPHCLRNNVANKVADPEMITDAYHSLNTFFMNNVSDSFTDKRIYQADDYSIYFQSGEASNATDYYLVGDSVYYDWVLNPIWEDVKTNIENTLDDAIRLINYLDPINSSITVNNDVYAIVSEGSAVTINLKGTAVRSWVTEIDDSVLTPVEESDQ